MIRVITTADGAAVLYDTGLDLVFGPLFGDPTEAREFLAYLCPADIRFITEQELEERLTLFRQTRGDRPHHD
jgi:hypothetical protein